MMKLSHQNDKKIPRKIAVKFCSKYGPDNISDMPG